MVKVVETIKFPFVDQVYGGILTITLKNIKSCYWINVYLILRRWQNALPFFVWISVSIYYKDKLQSRMFIGWELGVHITKSSSSSDRRVFMYQNRYQCTRGN